MQRLELNDLPHINIKHAVMTMTNPGQAQDWAIRQLYRNWSLTGKAGQYVMQCANCHGFGIRETAVSVASIRFRCGCGHQNHLTTPGPMHQIHAQITYPVSDGKPVTGDTLANIAARRFPGCWKRLNRVRYREIPNGYQDPALILWPYVVPSLLDWNKNRLTHHTIIRLIAERFVKAPPVVQWVRADLAEVVATAPPHQIPLDGFRPKWPYAAFMLPPGMLKTPEQNHIQAVAYATVTHGFHEVGGDKHALFANVPKMLLWARTDQGSDITATLTMLGPLGKAVIADAARLTKPHRALIGHLFNMVVRLGEVAALDQSVVSEGEVISRHGKKRARHIIKTAPILGQRKPKRLKTARRGEKGASPLEPVWVSGHQRGYWTGPKTKQQKKIIHNIAPFLHPKPEQEVQL